MKKIFLFLTAALLSINAFAVVTWDGTSSTAWTQGAGTSASPYLIESPAHLKYLSTQVNAGTTYSGKYFKQTQDFNLNSKTWTSIGTSSNKFAGNYDGGGKYISNFKTPIFGYVNNVTIKNLTLQGTLASYTDGSSTNFAALIYETAGTCTVVNCHYKGVATRTSSVSGRMTGFVYNVTGTKLTISKCSHTGKSTDAGFVYKVTSGKLEFKECYCKLTGTLSGYWSTFYAFVASAETTNCTIERSFFIEDVSKIGGSAGVPDVVCYFSEGGICAGCYWRGKRYTSFPSCSWRDSYAIWTTTATTTPTFTNSHVNCYKLYPYGTGEFTSRLDDQMKKEAFVDELNLNQEYFTMDYEGINDGYPILKWQAGTRYNITATCDANRGSVSGGGEFPNGYVATLTATPKPGCTFVGWSDGNTSNPRSVTVSGNATYVAQFTKSSYIIYVNQDCTSNIE